jgi:hypothetical protein
MKQHFKHQEGFMMMYLLPCSAIEAEHVKVKKRWCAAFCTHLSAYHAQIEHLAEDFTLLLLLLFCCCSAAAVLLSLTCHPSAQKATETGSCCQRQIRPTCCDAKAGCGQSHAQPRILAATRWHSRTLSNHTRLSGTL